jgi:virginiamycin B lyase
MYPVQSGLGFKTVPSVALFFLLAAGHLAAQAPSVSYTTYSGPSLISINWVTTGPDGALWFTGSGPAKTEIGRITTAGALTEYPLSNTPAVIVNGPDGALWFTERNVHQIGRITTGGSITEFPVPAEGEWLVSGPDGALWFTERNGVNIGRITTTGIVTEYPLPSLNANGAIVITVGPDGALWFTDSGTGDRIGRITTTGGVTEYAVPGSDRFLDSLVAGPDGALWYTTLFPAVIGRMTTGGVITAEYPFGTSESGLFPYDLTVGPDGALWFISASVDGGDIALGRITTTGIITEYVLPVSLPAGGSSITTGPDNALWIGGGGTATPFGTTPAKFVRVAVGSSLAVTTMSLPAGTVGSPYSASLTAQGGTPPYTWSVLFGSLPPGLSLIPATGAIAGTPTGGGTSFTVKVTDSSNASQAGTQALSIAIANANSIFSVASSPNGLSISVDGVSYLTPFTFTCSVGTQHTLTIASPQPAGISGGRYAFAGWSDGVSSPSRQISCPTTALTYTSNFTPQYLLTTTVAPAGEGTINAIPTSSDGFYNSGTTVQLTASSNFLSWSGDLSGTANPQSVTMSGPKSVTSNFAVGTSPAGAATFVKLDTSAGGSWKNAYGAEGYNVIGDAAAIPPYVRVTPSDDFFWTWASSTADTRALQKSNSFDRIAACWYAWGSFTIDLAFNDSNTHQFALYLLDFDIYGGGRTQRVDILDLNSNLLDTRSVSNFASGEFLVWNLSGHVRVRVTNTNPSGNAVVSGLFFGGVRATGTASFLNVDTVSSGSWKGSYGAEGYNVIDDAASYPAYVTVTPENNYSYVWAPATSDTRGLQKAPSYTDRIAACWYSGSSFSIDLTFNDSSTHQFALYLLDFDIYGGGRTERVDILDGNSNLLDTHSISNFVGGQYLLWTMSGHVTVRITNTNPSANAVVSGFFFR